MLLKQLIIHKSVLKFQPSNLETAPEVRKRAILLETA